jgi:hypothetical protein
MGKGTISSYSRKMKLNTRSSTETELVAADMYMPDMLWTLHFIQEQGYEAECVKLYQDNISAQLLMKNCRFSSGKKTKHIKAKFFFIKDHIDLGDLQVVDCPAEEMWADVLTKPLQGMGFKRMRAELMNCSVNYEEDECKNTTSTTKLLSGRGLIPTRTSQECVVNNRKSSLVKDRPTGLAGHSRPLVCRRGRK